MCERCHTFERSIRSAASPGQPYSMIKVDLTPKEALEQFFGFKKFKGEQEAIIQSVLKGRNTFVIMPTGGGKSLCY